VFLGRGRENVRHLFGIFLGILLFCIPAAAQEPSGADLPPPAGRVVLAVHGAIANTNVDDAALFDMEMLKALPSARLETVRRQGFWGNWRRELTEALAHQGFHIRLLLLGEASGGV
jgi:hypothetical protein